MRDDAKAAAAAKAKLEEIVVKVPGWAKRMIPAGFIDSYAAEMAKAVLDSQEN